MQSITDSGRPGFYVEGGKRKKVKFSFQGEKAVKRTDRLLSLRRDGYYFISAHNEHSHLTVF